MAGTALHSCWQRPMSLLGQQAEVILGAHLAHGDSSQVPSARVTGHCTQNKAG